jgi:DNA-binding GntR family transcriptional regulator
MRRLALRRASLGDRVYEELRQLIIRHELEPGQKVNLLDTAQRLEVSLTPLREALTTLKKEGFVTHYPNRGYFVAEITAAEAQQLFETREALECQAVRVGVSKLSEAHLHSIAEAVEAYRDVVRRPDRERFLQDKKLHLELATPAQNPILLGLLEQVLDRLIMKLPVEELPRERGAEAVREHALILASLRAHDAASAEARLRAHLQKSKAYIVSFLIARERAAVTA